MNFSYYKRERTVVPDIIHALDVTFLPTRYCHCDNSGVQRQHDVHRSTNCFIIDTSRPYGQPAQHLRTVHLKSKYMYISI